MEPPDAVLGGGKNLNGKTVAGKLLDRILSRIFVRGFRSKFKRNPIPSSEHPKFLFDRVFPIGNCSQSDPPPPAEQNPAGAGAGADTPEAGHGPHRRPRPGAAPPRRAAGPGHGAALAAAALQRPLLGVPPPRPPPGTAPRGHLSMPLITVLLPRGRAAGKIAHTACQCVMNPILTFFYFFYVIYLFIFFRFMHSAKECINQHFFLSRT